MPLTAAQIAAEQAEQAMTVDPRFAEQEQGEFSLASIGGGLSGVGAATGGSLAVPGAPVGGGFGGAGGGVGFSGEPGGAYAAPDPLVPTAPELAAVQAQAVPGEPSGADLAASLFAGPPVTQTLTETLRQQGQRVGRPRGPDMRDVPQEYLPQIGGRHMDPSIFEDEDAFTNELNTAVLQGDMTEEQRTAAIQKRDAYKKTYWGELGKGASIAQRGATLAGETKATEAEIQAGGAEATAGKLQDVEEDILAGREAGESRLVDYKAGRADLESERDKADKAILEHKIGDTRDVGSRIWDGIVAALGEASRALTGGARNNALDTIRANVDRSVHAQEVELASYKGQADKLRNNLSVYRQQFGDEENAKLALRDQQLEAHQRGLEQIIAETDNVSLQNRAQSIMSQIDLDRESIANQFTVGAHESKMAADAARQKAAAAAAARQPKEWRTGFGGKGQPNLNALSVNLGGGMYGIAPDAEAARDVRELSEYRAKMNGLINEQINIYSQAGSTFGAESLGKLSSNQSEMRTTMGVGKKLGALSKDDVGIVDSFMGGDPTENLTRKDRVLAGLRNATGVINYGYQTKLRTYGMPVAERRVSIEGPEYRYTGGVAGGGAKQVEEGAPDL